MPLANPIKQKIKLAFEAGRETKRSASGNVTLRYGGGGMTYLVKAGKQTATGAYYSEISGRDLGEKWDPDQIPTKHGRT